MVLGGRLSGFARHRAGQLAGFFFPMDAGLVHRFLVHCLN